jgi:4-azaleucine resistance transporter AzlC
VLGMTECAQASGGWRAGFRAGLPLGVATFALAISFGAFAVTTGWPPAMAVLSSALVLSGSAQFALVTAMSGAGGLITGVAAAALANARFIPMSAAVAPSLRGGRLRRAAEGQAVVDGSWVLAQRPDGSIDRERLFGATLAQLPAWVAGTAVGAFLVPSAETIESTGLDVVFPAFFLILLIDALREQRGLFAVAAASALVAAVSTLVVPAGAALLLASAAAGIELVRRPDGPAS